MADWIYVDNSNIWIEGKRVSAVKKGMARTVSEASDNSILDDSWRIDFGALYRVITDNNPTSVARALFIGSKPPEDDTIWRMARDAGFEVHVESRNAAGKEKKIDTGIVTELLTDAFVKASDGDMFIVVSGDADFVPAVRKLNELGKSVDVVYWEHASSELKDVATEFRSLNPHLDELSL